jgi:hypothetical protein
MAKFIIGVIVGIFLGAATSAYSSGVVVGWDQAPRVFLSELLETQHLRHPAPAVSWIAAVMVPREVGMSN